MGEPVITEGYVPYTPATAGKPCRTWYKTVGDLTSAGTRPLVIAHGRPGLSHDYLLSLTDLARAPHGIPLVFYDQIGNGRSTHLPEKMRDYAFWNEQLFLDELTAVLEHLGLAGRPYDLLGHSWGGMMGSITSFPASAPTLRLERPLRVQLSYRCSRGLNGNDGPPEHHA